MAGRLRGRALPCDHELGDFSPYWIYPGPYAVERHLLPFPLSHDGPRAAALKRDLAHYRLALGQPRQEDLLARSAGRRTGSSDRWISGLLERTRFRRRSGSRKPWALCRGG